MGLKILILSLLAFIVFAVVSRSSVSDSPVANNSVVSPSPAPTATPLSLSSQFDHQYDGRDFTLGRVLATNDVYTRYYITYKSADLTISGIMNLPHGDGPFPVLILNHGYIDPSIYTNGRGLRREQDYFAHQGYIVIHPDYRNHNGSDRDPQAEINLRQGYVEDVINVVMAVKESDLAYFDKTRIGMIGHSMGGGIALNIMVIKPDLVKAFVLLAPVSSNQVDNFNRWLSRRPTIAQIIINRYGAPQDNSEFWKNVSASTYFDRIQSPVMLHHGTADADVPLSWSDNLHRLLQSHGKNTIYHTYPGQPHEFTSSWTTVMDRSLEFFNLNLQP